MTHFAKGQAMKQAFSNQRVWRVCVLAAGSLLVLAGCAGFEPHLAPGPEPQAQYRALTTPIIAVGDTQEHLPSGYPMLDNDSTVDTYVEVAQRPPEQPLFGRRIIEWVLNQHPDEPFIHLGDVLDLSCRIEAERITKIMRAAPSQGVIFPGNHDGLMFGIYGFNVFEAASDRGVQKWNRACRRGAADDDSFRTDKEAFTKRDFIALYLSELPQWRGSKPGLPQSAPRGNQRISWQHPDRDAYLNAVEARLIDGVNYSDSFLLQRIRLPAAPGAKHKVTLIGLDTNQAGVLVSTWDTLMGRSPGDMGHVHPDQIEVVNRWVSEAVERNELVVFAGHHNWRSLGLPSRTLVSAVMSRLRHPLLYLSAHTHSGFWAEHRTLSQQPLLELNVSSLSDWPIAYRRIALAYDEQAKRLQVRGELMPHRGRPNRDYADLLAAWEEQACASAGMPLERIRSHDKEVVKKQRESRGNLIGWLLEYLRACDTCEQPTLYEHAHAYQDDLLETLLQADEMVRQSGRPLPEIRLPAQCTSQDFRACATGLLAEKPADYRAQVDLFRRKASLVLAVNQFLDKIDDPKAKAYMTCRAVQSAKIDFDDTAEDRNGNRSETKRRTEQFFRIEASVGVE